ncbi:MAG: aldehyde ferredoxin oxidoreductase C-terminal domain-containing protein [Candidatus Desulfofervidaceae bacterium]|nr:aldehyde ferredoxin oxidoreductase C-terminal domain-containing protein [Candidatus Desulfofervidaceae bacterium]
MKAIAVRGTKDVFLHDGKVFVERVLESAKDFSQNDKLKTFSNLSTYLSFETLLKANGIPCCYFTKPYQVNLSLSEIKNLWERERGCFSCPVACLKATQKGKFLPEIDALTALGPLCGIHDVSAIFDAYDLCVKTGLDPVETGTTLACLMKLGEEGVLEKENLEIEPKFGDKEALLKLLAFIGKGEKGSSTLGKGAYQLSQHLQKPDLFMGVKGRSICFDVTNLPYLGLQYATSNTGFTYLSGPTFLDKGLKREEIPGKVKLVQDKTAALEAMGICPYVTDGFALDVFLSMFQAATGIELEEADLLKIGEAICNLEREFAQKAGVDLGTGTLPEKISPSGFKELIDKYYQLRGWK